jgi:hypothetical protein
MMLSYLLITKMEKKRKEEARASDLIPVHWIELQSIWKKSYLQQGQGRSSFF